MEDIVQWFKSGCNYDQGVRLYLLHGDQEQYRQLFREEYSPFKAKELKKCLKALLESTAPLAAAKEPVQFPVNIQIPLQDQSISLDVPNEAKIGHGWPDEKPDYIQRLYDEWMVHFSELKHLEHTIYSVAVSADKDPDLRDRAREMALKILELDEVCESIYAKRDFFLLNNKAPEPDQKETTDPLKLVVKLENAKRYVRQYKSKLAKEPQNLSFAKKLKEYESEVIRLKIILKIDDESN
jgi:6-pyruvoyl-tetrahydropterin synthase